VLVAEKMRFPLARGPRGGEVDALQATARVEAEAPRLHEPFVRGIDAVGFDQATMLIVAVADGELRTVVAGSGKGLEQPPLATDQPMDVAERSSCAIGDDGDAPGAV